MGLFYNRVNAIELLRSLPQTNISEWKTPKGFRLKDIYKGPLCNWKRSKNFKLVQQKPLFNETMDELSDLIENLKI